MKLLINIVDGETGEEITRPMTDEEIAELEAARLQAQEFVDAREQEIADAEVVRQSALEKLQALGLTEEEAKAIAGI